MFNKAFTFDDVALVPQFNNIPSRTEPNLETWLTRTHKMKIPIICSNMDTVINEDMADIMLENGSMPLFHRFADIAKQKKWAEKYGKDIFLSCGIKNIEETYSLLDSEVRGVCIDVAHGHSDKMIHYIEKLKKKYPGKEIIAGNVCTPMAYHDLVNAGADAVRVGIGPGAACTTRIVTGFGVPQFSAIRDCAKVADKLRVPLIADGGIRNSRDIVLALAAGASCVMIGKLFALTNESAATKRTRTDGVLEAKYRGQASEDFQKEFYGGLKEKTVAEGTAFWAPVEKTAQELLDSLLGSIRSGMTYGGARNLKELQRKAEFVLVTPSYTHESFPRKG
jgi:IMP dehydrogenase